MLTGCENEGTAFCSGMELSVDKPFGPFTWQVGQLLMGRVSGYYAVVVEINSNVAVAGMGGVQFDYCCRIAFTGNSFHHERAAGTLQSTDE